MSEIAAQHLTASPTLDDKPCGHLYTEPVQLLNGEIVAHLCASCLQQLPPEWHDCCHDPIRDTRLGDLHDRYLCRFCGAAWTGDRRDGTTEHHNNTEGDTPT